LRDGRGWCLTFGVKRDAALEGSVSTVKFNHPARHTNCRISGDDLVNAHRLRVTTPVAARRVAWPPSGSVRLSPCFLHAAPERDAINPHCCEQNKQVQAAKPGKKQDGRWPQGPRHEGRRLRYVLS